MARFVLIHGALHGAWCWESVIPLLERLGHEVVAPDLPGMGADTAPLAEVTLEQWSECIIDIARSGVGQAILVGHSRGGIVISDAAERAPNAVAGLVYVSAMLLPDNESMMGFAAKHMPHLGDSTIVCDDGISTRFDPSRAEQIFYNRTDPQIAAAAIDKLTPEPVAPNVTPLTLTKERFGRIRRAYIECSEDNAVPLPAQRLMQESLVCDPVVTLDSDHSPFLSCPAALAASLNEIARKWDVP